MNCVKQCQKGFELDTPSQLKWIKDTDGKCYYSDTTNLADGYKYKNSADCCSASGNITGGNIYKCADLDYTQLNPLCREQLTNTCKRKLCFTFK